jgi:three-Cys-motif partner protein
MPRKSEPEFWETAKDWSKRKHLIVSYYLKPATAKLRAASPDGRVIILDGFAGKGQYDDEWPGSPILMGRLADQCHSWSNPIDLRIFNIETGKENFRELERHTAPWVERGVIQNLEGTFQRWLPFVLKETARSPLFAFLDPFRPTDLLFSHFLPLLKRQAITELCFVFHTPLVARWIYSIRPDARTSEQTKQSSRASLNEVFGSNRWETLLAGSELDADAVVGCFGEELLAQSLRVRTFVGAHPIRERYGGALKYHIVFLTRNPHGVRLMNDAFWKEVHRVYGESATPQLNLDLDVASPPVEMSPSGQIELLSNTILEIGSHHPGRTWKRSDLVLEAMCRRLGEFSESQHLQAIKLLLARSVAPRLIPINARQTRRGDWQTNKDTLMRFDLAG